MKVRDILQLCQEGALSLSLLHVVFSLLFPFLSDVEVLFIF